MTNAQKRAMRRQFDTQLRYERNAAAAGESYVPPEIAAGMTREKPPETLYQVMVELPGFPARPPLAVGPRVIREVAEEFAVVINAFAARGLEKIWRHATVVPVLAATSGVH